MGNKLDQFITHFKVNNDDEQNVLDDLIKELGLDKCLEMLKNFKNLKNTSVNLNPYEFDEFALYEFSLSTLLFSLLRREENSVKGFLCNIKGNTKVQIEERSATFSRKKYYFKFPYRNDKFIYIRTSVYKHGRINYYDAIKTLDFGDINLLFMHLSDKEIGRFSKNKNIVADLDRSRKLRNYVYHHNLLFSLGKDELKKEIIMVIKNLPIDKIKQYFINKLNNLKNRYEYANLSNDLVIKINKSDYQFIF